MITKELYHEKLMGCWMGKNIGGTLGAPLESTNCMSYTKFYDYYLQELTEGAIPNDDLDLQLVWLNAAEKYKNCLNSRILGEYWLSYIFPNPSEYGAAKGNLMAGIVPPLSGEYKNIHKNSCGAFIRSEVWACLAPGHPETAVRYAIMDAEVDHSGEGVYAEIFCAALESAAFFESDREKLIEIAVSYLPEECGIRNAIKSVQKSYKDGLTWKQAFFELMKIEPSSFSHGNFGWVDENGTKIECRETGYDAPGNIGIVMIGWYYGEGDFGKSLSIALNCGEDTDCTCATLGAVMGILCGEKKIPDKWKKPIGHKIISCCINDMDWTITIPKTLEELVERIMFLSPVIIGKEHINSDSIIPAEKFFYTGLKSKYTKFIDYERVRSPYKVRYEFEMMDILFDYKEDPVFAPNSTKKFSVKLLSNRGTQFVTKIKIHHSEDVQIPTGDEMSCYLYQFYHAASEFEFEVNFGEINAAKIEFVLEVSIEGRCEKCFIPIVLFNDRTQCIINDAVYGKEFSI